MAANVGCRDCTVHHISPALARHRLVCRPGLVRAAKGARPLLPVLSGCRAVGLCSALTGLSTSRKAGTGQLHHLHPRTRASRKRHSARPREEYLHRQTDSTGGGLRALLKPRCCQQHALQQQWLRTRRHGLLLPTPKSSISDRPNNRFGPTDVTWHIRPPENQSLHRICGRPDATSRGAVCRGGLYIGTRHNRSWLDC